jgi:hypothetical protein
MERGIDGMMRVKVHELWAGMHPSEVLVEVLTADGGAEEVFLDRRSIKNGSVLIGYPVGSRDGHFLIELPRETARGCWRVWVSPEMLIPDRVVALAEA